jgi:PPM family protein phosphatase
MPLQRSMLNFAVRCDRGSVFGGDVAYVGPRLLALASGGVSLPSPGSASAVAIEVLQALGAENKIDDPLISLKLAIEQVVSRLRTLTESDSAWRTTSTSLTAILYVEGRVTVAHIGGCRAFIAREGRINQVTRDHTLDQFLLDERIASADEVAANPDRFYLTRWLNGYHEADFEFSVHGSRIGDRLFVCTKEYWRVVPSGSIHRPLIDLSHPDEAAESLIGLSRQPDSLGATCIVADIVADPSEGYSRKCEPIIVGAFGTPPWNRT